jgi:hypothetical protein
VTHARTPQPLDLDALQRIPAEAWAGVRLIASDAVRLLRFEYPVNPFYQAYRDHGVVPPLPAASATATAVYRREIALWRMDLTPAMARVLDALLAARPLGEALARIGLAEPDAQAQAEAERSVMIWFREWVAGGLFTRVECGPPAGTAQ